MGRIFKCEVCEETFESDWTDQEAEAEYAEAFPESKLRNVERGLACTDCYEKMIASFPPYLAEKLEYGNE